MVPYASASSGMRAREEIRRILQRLGCDDVGFMDKLETQEVLLVFTHRGRQVQLKASARGWASMYLRKNPWNGRRRISRHDYEQAAIKQGLIATNSILRDLVKGSVTAIETGILSFEAVFMPHMLTTTGQTVLERITTEGNLLPAPEPQKIVQLATG